MERMIGERHPLRRRLSRFEETEVRTLLSTLAVATLAASTMVPMAQAAPVADQAGVQQAADSLAAIEKTQYFWGGYNYCWYPDGWHGPGWYWCGYAWRHGFGWGGGYGWHGWHGGGGGWHGGGWHGGGWHGGGFHGGGFHGGFHGGGGHGHR
jgi:hypothetical protein